MFEVQADQIQLYDLLDLIATNRKTGVLVLEWPGEQARLAFEEGKLVYARRNRGPVIGDYLMSRGKLRALDLLRLLQLQRYRPRRIGLGAALMKAGLVEAKDLNLAVSSQIVDVLTECLFWSQEPATKYRFMHRDEDLELCDVSLPETQVFMIEATCRFDYTQHLFAA